MSIKDGEKSFIFRYFVNSFHYFYQDAEYLLQVAKSEALSESFDRTRVCRTAVLLFIFSLEGLINRATDHFLPEHLREFFTEREEKFSLEDKFTVLPILVSGKQFDVSCYPWSHFKELVRMRNDFVHPKHDRPGYYKVIFANEWEPLPWNEIPKDLNVNEADVVYRNMLIPKDPYAILPEHAEKVKKVVDDMVFELDKILDGKISNDNWCRSDKMKLIYPPGANINDIPVRKK